MSGDASGAYDLSVIIPTYREAENLPVIVPRIADGLRRAGLKAEIVVVDDNSPDDTLAVCEKLSKEFPVRLLVRTNERGLSTAVIHGMRQSSGEVLVVIDADLSHPPEKIPHLYELVKTGKADFVIGSRYVKGGRTEDGWGLFRWFNSKLATLLARPLTRAKDPMAGFIGLRRETFVRARKLDPVGYKIGL